MRKYKDWKKKVKRLKIEMDTIKMQKDTNVFNGEHYVKSYDKRKYKEKEVEYYKEKYYLYLDKYSFNKISKRKLNKIWDEYLGVLNKKVKLLKQERNQQINGKWVADKIEISELLLLIKTEKNLQGAATTKRYDLVRKTLVTFLPVMVVILLVGTPFGIGAIVSIQGCEWLVTDNSWIGFFGSYVGSIVGAGVGGFVAYMIAKNGFKQQKELDRQAKITDIRIKSLTDFIVSLTDIQYLLYIIQNHVRFTDVNSSYEIISNSYELIKNNNQNLLDLLEKGKTVRERSIHFIQDYDEALTLLNISILEIQKISFNIETYLREMVSKLKLGDIMKTETNVEFYKNEISKLVQTFISKHTLVDEKITKLVLIFRNISSNDLLNT